MINRTKKILNASVAVINQRQTDILIAAGVIMISYGASLLLGLVRQRLMGSLFYNCCASDLDAFQAAFRIPDLFFQTFIVGTLTMVYLPILAENFNSSVEEGKKSAYRILTLLSILMLVASVLIFIFSPLLAKAMSPTKDESYINLLSNLMRIIFGSQIIFLFSTWTSTILQTLKKFIGPSLAPLTYNLGIISSTILFHEQIGIYAPALGVFIGAILHLSIQLPGLYQLGIKINFTNQIWDKELFTILSLSWPRLITQAIVQLENAISVYFASLLTTGSVFLYDLATLLRQVPVQLVGLAIGQAAYPSLAQYATKKSDYFVKVSRDTILQIFYFVLPLTAIMLILRIPIVRLAFGSASFPWNATLTTGMILGLFSIGIPAIAVSQLLTRVYYAKKNFITPLLIQVLGIFIFIAVIWSGFLIGKVKIGAGVGSWEITGLMWIALASSLASIIRLILFGVFADFKWKSFWMPILNQIIKLLVAFYYTLICLWIPFQFLDKLVFDTTRVVPLIALTVTTSLIGLSVYIIMCHWLNVDSQNYLWKTIIKFPGVKSILKKTQSIISPIVDISS